MAFCRQCGAGLNGSRFCPNCGAANDGNTTHREGYSVTSDIRRQSLSEMNDMMKYFGVKKAQYDRFDEIGADIDRRSAQGYHGWLITGILCAVIAFWLLKITDNLWNVGGVILLEFPAVVILAIYTLLKKKNNEKLRIAKKRHEKIGMELAEYYNAYGYCPLGIEYTNPAILAKVNDTIRQGRANTPEEALNILLDDIHKAELEQSAAAAAAAAAETAKYSKQTAKSTKKSARYASADFWLK